MYYQCVDLSSYIFDELLDSFKKTGYHKICEDICPTECNSVIFSITPFTRSINNNFSRIFIYYENLEYEFIEEWPKMTSDSLFGALGGIFSLFLGMSLLSFAEIIELIISYQCIIFDRIKRESMKIDKDLIKEDSVIDESNITAENDNKKNFREISRKVILSNRISNN